MDHHCPTGRRYFAVAVTALLFTTMSCGWVHERRAISAPSDCSHPNPGVSAQEIRVGTIYPTTGPSAVQFAPVGAGVRARFAAENADGGIGGRSLTMVQGDDGDGEVANLNAARQLVVDEKVFGIIEATTSSDGAGRFLADEHIPVTGWGITPAWGRYRNMFGYHYSISPKPEGEPVTRAAEFIKAHGGHRVAIIAGGAGASVNVANQVAETLPKVGLTLGYKSLNVPLGSNNFATDVQKMKENGVDAIYTGMGTEPNIALYQTALRAGLHLNVTYFPSGYDERLAQAAGDKLEGVYFGIDWRPFELPVPAHERFRRMMAQVAPTEYPGQLAMVGWLSADTFIRGLHAAGAECPTRRAFITNLRLVNDYTADGLVPRTDFSEVFGKMALCSFVLQLRDKHFVPVSGKPFCGVLLKDYHP